MAAPPIPVLARINIQRLIGRECEIFQLAVGIERVEDFNSRGRLRSESRRDEIGIGGLVRVHVKALGDLDDDRDFKRFSARDWFERNECLRLDDGGGARERLLRARVGVV